jgi:putative ABC transport system permease protein
MELLIQDLRYTFRTLWKSPAFALVAVVTLSLGIGANTAVFSVVNAVLLRPLPYASPERLITMRGNQSRVDIEDVKQRTTTLQDGGAITIQPMDYTGGSEPLRLQAGLVDADLFSVLGVRPMLGRTLSADEDQVGAPRLVVLGHSFWQQSLGSDPNIVGRNIPLSGQSYQVIGVMPAEFSLPRGEADVLASLRVAYSEAAVYRGVHFMRSYWRLKPGVSIAQAQGEMASIDSVLSGLYPAEDKGRKTQLVPLQEWVVGKSRQALLILFGAVGFVLLIACANFANLLLARAVSRHDEIVIRAALGASRWRLVSQILTESLLVALLGCAAGLLLAHWGIALLIALRPADLPRLSEISIDWRVAGFALATSLLAGSAFGFAPAWSSVGGTRAESLHEPGRGASSGGRTQRLRDALVVGELALALVLLTGAGLLLKGFWLLRSVDPGFSPDNLLTMQVQLPQNRYDKVERQTQFRHSVLDGLNAIPGVQAAMVSEIPMSGDFVFHNFVVEGRAPLPEGSEPEAHSRSVMGDYFETMHIPLSAGRGFTAQDREGMPLVAVVNDAMVHKFFAGRSPLGERIRWARLDGPPQWITIVGVSGDVRQFGLDHEDEPAIYTPYSQLMQSWKRWMTLVVRTKESPLMLIKAAKSVIWSVDRQIPVSKVRTMATVMEESGAEREFNTVLLGAFAAIALALAAIGIYGLTSYSVTQRTYEIGIRMALGATPGNVLQLVVRKGLVLVAAGLGLGIAAAVALTRFMTSLLFGVRPTDVATFSWVAVILAIVSLVASYIPARRATAVDPIIALRYD